MDGHVAPGERAPRMQTGLVLGGGAARGAYEAGVISYLRDELPHEIGHHVRLDVLAGTSVGAINACFVGATANRPGEQGKEIVESWRSLELDEVLAFGVGDVVRVLREAMGRAPVRRGRGRHGGLVDPRGLEAIVGRRIPWVQLGRNLRHGIIDAVAISATNVGTGRTTVFVQRREGTVPPWSRDGMVVATHARIGPKHALASAAIPVLFPAVTLGGYTYVDGGLRLNVPLSPALRLGADRVIVVSLRHAESADPPPPGEGKNLLEHRAASAPFLLGKALNAFMLDHTDQDLNRLRRLNGLLEAGTSAWGRTFERVLNEALLPMRKAPIRYVRNILVRPSKDIAKLAAEYAASQEFRRRASGLAGRVVRRLAASEAPDEADLASYLLFDGAFADQLVELGRSDARALGTKWARFFSSEPQSEAEAACLESRARGG